MMKDTIIVVGGYGHVGKTISRSLSEKFPGKVYAAGRNVQTAKRFSEETGGKVRQLQLDIGKPFDKDILKRAKLIVMCLDQTDTDFVRACFQNGVHYIDISAKGSFLAKVEGLREAAEAGGATAVLSVGLAPGLTSLMASQAVKLMDAAKAIDISIMLGLGDRHGKAAIEWTVDNLNARFEIMEDNGLVAVESFTDGKTTDFGADLGRKKSFRFPFSDQQTLARTLAVPSVSTRLCFDSGIVTSLVAAMKAAGLFRFLQTGWVRKTVVRSFGQISFGKERFAVKVDAWGIKEKREVKAECMLHGSNEAEMTGMTAAFVAEAVYRTAYPSGVYHIEQLFSLENMQPLVQRASFAEMRLNGRKLNL
ncbi:saccharopine dehydrogenase family protein [Paenibacillus contaminans]|uniref:Saccharopine dehydrogenase n=1 Tax=Paenibacillus contaminans TaxID=450362 RepID=A0A329MSF0_9BACL|nr:saccharopine dehydrogenase NADP-binding domain-containing protein [Paenibacillus contaminans]RAV22901.1 saccharopine dehydrogenase [Paenibacillus contaminans]